MELARRCPGKCAGLRDEGSVLETRRFYAGQKCTHRVATELFWTRSEARPQASWWWRCTPGHGDARHGSLPQIRGQEHFPLTHLRGTSTLRKIFSFQRFGLKHLKSIRQFCFHILEHSNIMSIIALSGQEYALTAWRE